LYFAQGEFFILREPALERFADLRGERLLVRLPDVLRGERLERLPDFLLYYLLAILFLNIRKKKNNFYNCFF